MNETEKQPPSSFRSPKPALVVEDDPSLRELLKEIIIEATPYWPVTVGCCKGAARAAEDQKPAVAVMDYRLPDLNGIDCLEKLKMLERIAAKCRVILISANPPWYAYKRPDITVIKKPFDLDHLVRAITGENENVTETPELSSVPQHPSSHQQPPQSKPRE